MTPAKPSETEAESIDGICRGISELLHMVLVKRATLLIGELHDHIDQRDARLSDHDEILTRISNAVIEADEKCSATGGANTIGYLRDCLLPILNKHGLQLRLKP